jgi:hypothetical protein
MIMQFFISTFRSYGKPTFPNSSFHLTDSLHTFLYIYTYIHTHIFMYKDSVGWRVLYLPMSDASTSTAAISLCTGQRSMVEWLRAFQLPVHVWVPCMRTWSPTGLPNDNGGYNTRHPVYSGGGLDSWKQTYSCETVFPLTDILPGFSSRRLPGQVHSSFSCFVFSVLSKIQIV